MRHRGTETVPQTAQDHDVAFGYVAEQRPEKLRALGALHVTVRLVTLAWSRPPRTTLTISRVLADGRRRVP
eukprot:66486-Rhodomonas_salina.2